MKAEDREARKRRGPKKGEDEGKDMTMGGHRARGQGLSVGSSVCASFPPLFSSIDPFWRRVQAPDCASP